MSAKRDRKPVSCNPCRQRKLKCDRALPACESCLRRGDVTSCMYQARKPGSQRHWPVSHQSANSIESRINEMEQLIRIMVDRNSHSNFIAPEYAEPLTPLSTRDSPIQQAFVQNCASPCPESNPLSGGPQHYCQQKKAPRRNEIMEIGAERGRLFCVGEAHWAVLLNEIAEVRNYLETQRSQTVSHTQKQSFDGAHLANKSASSLGLGVVKPMSRREITSQLPSRSVCDVLVARYFYSLEPALHILHVATFRKKYAEFRSQSETLPVSWIGLLCAVMRLAILSWQREGSEFPETIGDATQVSNHLHTLATNALVLADYAQPQEYLVEALCLHMHGEYVASRDANPNVYILLGMIVRIAMRMGYHRESRHIPDLSPFQGEMRRRVWAYIRMADILFSFQAGLPSMIRIRDCDANFPHNIHDDAVFYETCPQLPAPRLDSEITQVSFLIIKSRLTAGFARALKEMNSPDQPPYDRVLEVDRGLRQMYDKIPEYFQLQPLSQMSSEPLTVIASRFMLANIFHKSICVVHSRYLEAARNQVQYMYSRRACLESAMRLLGFQALQAELASRPGSKQATTRYQTSLTTHDYLLGATIICAELSLKRDPLNVAQRKDSGPVRSELVLALQRSAQRWHQMREYSMEAQKASDLLGMICIKFQSSAMPLDPHTLSSSYSLHKGRDSSLNCSRAVNVTPKIQTAGAGGRRDDYPEGNELSLETPPSRCMTNEMELAQPQFNLSDTSSHQPQLLASGDTCPSTQLLEAAYMRGHSATAALSTSQADINSTTTPPALIFTFDLTQRNNHVEAPHSIQQPDTDWASWNTNTPMQTFDFGDPWGTLWNFDSGSTRNLLPSYDI